MKNDPTVYSYFPCQQVCPDTFFFVKETGYFHNVNRILRFPEVNDPPDFFTKPKTNTA